MMNKAAPLPPDYVEFFGGFSDGFEKSLEEAARDRIAGRIWERDCSVWKGDAELIANRLGWLSLPENTAQSLEKIERFARRCRQTGAERVVLAGMGGSALASKVFGNTFASEGFPRLTVLDTTVADTIAAVAGEADFGKTFFIVSSKSGRTVETVSLADFFFERCARSLGAEKAAERFAVITDNGTPLYISAKKRGFAVFEGDETVGGRFSPLSFFGMVPAAVAGGDVGKILSGARSMSMRLRSPEISGANANTALRLAMAISLFCGKGNGAFYVRCSDQLAGFDRFVEQIIGESTAKQGRSVLPIVHPCSPVSEGVSGAVFVCLKDDAKLISRARSAASGGMPVVMTVLEDRHGIGGEVFRWEMAAAILGALRGVNPFDQPDVENAKAQARRFMNIYREKGSLPFPAPDFKDADIEFRTSDPVPDAGQLRSYLRENARKRKKNGYFSVQAFLDGSDGKLRKAVENFRAAVSKRFGVAVTADFGPAYLHSSGQIHKGDAGNGLFIQLCGKCREDISIPEYTPDSGGASFEILKDAQALGDKEALELKGRKVVQIKFLSDAVSGIGRASGLLGIESPL